MNSLSSLFKRVEESFPDSELFKDLMLLHRPDMYDNLALGLQQEHKNIDRIVFEYECSAYPTITCGIITYNEERCIRRCLHSVMDEFDEIIVVDSGSNDSTLTIIKDMQKRCSHIKVLVEPWRNDFSFHRNKIIENAEGDWIYFIDADNVYSKDNKGKMKRIARLLDFLGIDCVISPKIIEHDESISLDNRRMFSLKKGILFSGKVHEEPILLNGDIPINIPANIIVEHDGYNPQIIDIKKKNERNKELTKEMMEIDPLNPKWFYFYARELYNSKDDIHIVKDSLIKAIELSKSTNSRFSLDAMLMLCRVLFENNDFKLLEDHLGLFEQLYPNCSDTDYYRALMIRMNIEQKITRLIHVLKESFSNVNKKYSFINESNDHIKLLVFELLILINDWDRAMEVYHCIKSEKLRQSLMRRLYLYIDEISNRLCDRIYSTDAHV